ncbi:MAG TPA: hydroxymethylbilane synthase, partial [Armatimonadota bacterium]|nr:hydroxymethylbilane synthase [Armatimonadota bacterium]
MTHPIRLGSRGSTLALTQSNGVADALARRGHPCAIIIIRTTGDRLAEQPIEALPGKGVFVNEIEQALRDRAVDLAVHSMKDLPGDMPAGLTIAAAPPREDTRDVLVGPLQSPVTLASLPAGARLGTSSLRRKAQILALRPDLTVLDMRGNVDTRLRKLDDGHYDAIVLAAAGLHRLGLAARIHEYLPSPAVLPAAGQGALALQTRADDAALIAALAPLNDDATMRAARAERTVLAELGGGCAIPLGVLATVEG